MHGSAAASADNLCPNCHSDNPAVAILCWACSTALPNHIPPLRSSPRQEALKPAAFFGGLALAIASGWLPRRYRGLCLAAGTGSAIFATLPEIADCFNNFKLVVLGRTLIDLTPPKIPEFDFWNPNAPSGDGPHLVHEPPIVRITNNLFLYAFKDGATAIRLSAGTRAVVAAYLVEGEWREGMRMPVFLWRDLKNHLQAGLTAPKPQRPENTMFIRYEGQGYPLSHDLDYDGLVEHIRINIEPAQ